MFDAVIQSLQSLVNFSEKDLSFFPKQINNTPCCKDDFVLKEGTLCEAIYFILRGSCIHILPGDDGKGIRVFAMGFIVWVILIIISLRKQPSL